MDERLDIKVTSKVLKNSRGMLWLTEDMRNVCRRRVKTEHFSPVEN